MNDEILITRSVVQKESQSTSYPSERIDLPSKGYFYSDNDPLSLGYIDMKMMTAKYLDCANNVAHVGHANPEVVKKINY